MCGEPPGAVACPYKRAFHARRADNQPQRQRDEEVVETGHETELDANQVEEECLLIHGDIRFPKVAMQHRGDSARHDTFVQVKIF
jgi:hypothetical protein